MSAKQSSEIACLFVRIPTALKKRVSNSARAHHVSMSQEVERLLGEQLKLDLPAYLKHQAVETELTFCNANLRALEGFLVSFVLSSDLKEVESQISYLRNYILKSRADRQKNKRKLERELKQRRKEHEAALGNAERHSVLDVLINPEKVASRLGQLPETERRRVNLLLELSDRPRGTRKRIANALGWKQSQLSQLLSHPTATGHRRMNGSIARKVEAELGLEKRALDRPEQSALNITVQKFEDVMEGIKCQLFRGRH